jgi:predicted nicotinamide N-methyase
VPFLTALGPPLCELPHAHDTHVPVAVAPLRVRLAEGRALTLVAPTDAAAVETMHALLGEEVDAVWAEVWPSAVAMADELLACPALVAGASVCELGAGLGLGGLAAAQSGAARVCVTDREPRALWCALAAAAANGMPAAPLPPALAATLPPLPAMSAASSPRCLEVSAALLDWDAPLPAHLRSAFGVLLLADVLYQPDSVARLADVAAALLAPGGRVILADTATRKGKQGLRRHFLDELLRRAGGTLVIHRRPTRTVAMPAPEADSNTGDAHDVEMSVIAPADWTPGC